MTEAEWWTATDLAALVHRFMACQRIADRKVRLFSLACCRLLERHLDYWPCAVMLPLLEEFADGRVGPEALPEKVDSVERDLGRMQHVFRAPHPSSGADAALGAAFTYRPAESEEFHSLIDTIWSTTDVLREVGLSDRPDGLLVPFLHDIFGPLPFRDVAVAPAWLTSDVLALARGIYDEKAFDRMPILADALQDAGCDNDEVLNHCRAAGWEHIRGCWVVDLLLGKPWREA